VVVVNDTLARRLWPGEEALGKRFRLRGGQHPYLEVVGVAGDGRYNSIFERPRPFFDAPHSMEFRSLRVLHVSTAGAPKRIAPLVRKEVAALGPDVALRRTGEGQGSGVIRTPRCRCRTAGNGGRECSAEWPSGSRVELGPVHRAREHEDDGNESIAVHAAWILHSRRGPGPTGCGDEDVVARQRRVHRDQLVPGLRGLCHTRLRVVGRPESGCGRA